MVPSCEDGPDFVSTKRPMYNVPLVPPPPPPYLSYVEMSEPEEGASQDYEATATGLLHCDTSSSDGSKLYGWAEGTDYSTDVSDTNKKRTMASKNNKKRRTNPWCNMRGREGGRERGSEGLPNTTACSTW